MSKKKSKNKNNNSSNVIKEVKERVELKDEIDGKEIKTCPKCATPVTKKYCPNCGENVESLPVEEIKEETIGTETKVEEEKKEEKTCPKCSIPVTRKYCPNCGENVESLPLEEIKEETIETETKVEEEKKEEKTCPKCSTPVTRKYCPNCGENVESLPVEEIKEETIGIETKVEEEKKEEKTCPKCSTPVTKKYCPNCGENVEFSSQIVEEQVEQNIPLEVNQGLTPPISSVGIPGVTSIPNVGMDHNSVKQFNFTNNLQTDTVQKKSPTKVVLISIFVVIAVIILFVTTILVVNKKEKGKPQPEPLDISNIPSNSLSNSNSNTNTTVEETEDIVVLSCSLEENYMEGINAISKSTYIFQNGKIIKAVDEEILEFGEKGMQYYDTYYDVVKEELLDDSYNFDNAVLEMIKTENSIGLSYTIDLDVDTNNLNNNLDLIEITYQEAKKELEQEGYTCK